MKPLSHRIFPCLQAFALLVMACLTPAAEPAPVGGPLEVNSHGLSVQVTGLSEGNQADAKLVIEEQSALTEDKTVSPPLADDFAFFVRQRLLELGYPEAVVDWEISGNTAILKVTEGPRYSVGEIKFEGNTSQPDEELTKYLLRPTHEKLGSTTNHPPFIEAAVKEGRTLVQRYFQSQGYLDVEVEDEPRFVMQPTTATVDITLAIKEGPRYDLGEIQLEGDLLNKEKEIHQQIKDLSGQPYSEVKLEAVRTNVVGLFQQIGYFHPDVTWQADPSKRNGGAVPVLYRIIPGERYRIEQVEISPAFSRGATRLIRSSFKRAEGTIYSPSDLEVMHRRLLDTEVFSKLEITPVSDENAHTLVLQLTGEEAKRKRLAVFGGYQSFVGGIAGVELRAVNLFDTGHAGLLKGEINALGLNGEVRWMNPALFNTGFSLNTAVAAESRTYFDDYDTRTLSGRPTLTRQWNKYFTSSVFAEYALSTTESETLTPIELGPADYTVQRAGLTLTVDFRNNPVSPTDGWYTSGTVAYGTMTPDEGENQNFLSTDLVFSVYQPITKKIRVSASAKTSAMVTDDGASGLPINLRLFNGGANSVRSFPEREMGLKSASGTPLGGTLTQVFSAEVSYEIIPNLEFALFTDAGSVSSTEDNIFSMPDDLRYAVGAGLRYKLPVGPLRIDYGYNPDRREGEPAGALHITFGFAF